MRLSKSLKQALFIKQYLMHWIFHRDHLQWKERSTNVNLKRRVCPSKLTGEARTELFGEAEQSFGAAAGIHSSGGRTF